MKRKWSVLLLTVVPGLGHIYAGRQWRGLLLFALFAIAINGYVAGTEMTRSEDRTVRERGRQVRVACTVGAIGVWIFALVDIARLSKQFESKPRRERKDYHFKRGLHHYLAGTYESARGEFLTVLKLDSMDADARYYLGMTHQALGNKRRAVRAFKRCLAADTEKKWNWEAKAQLKKVRRTG